MKKNIECKHCQKTMDIRKVKKHTGKWPLYLIIIGIFCFLFLGGPFLGIPLIILGIFMYTAELTICYCDECGHYFKVWVDEKND